MVFSSNRGFVATLSRCRRRQGGRTISLCLFGACAYTNPVVSHHCILSTHIQSYKHTIIAGTVVIHGLKRQREPRSRSSGGGPGAFRRLRTRWRGCFRSSFRIRTAAIGAFRPGQGLVYNDEPCGKGQGEGYPVINGKFGSTSRSQPANPLAWYRKYPAAATIAALSVHNLGGG